VYMPIGVQQIKSYCAALHARGDALSDVLQQLQQGSCSIGDGMHRVANILVQCCGHMARNQRAHMRALPTPSRRRRGVDAPWYDVDECRLLRGELSSAWSAHLADRARLDLRAAAVAARKSYKAVIHRKKYQHEQECQVKQLHDARTHPLPLEKDHGLFQVAFWARASFPTLPWTHHSAPWAKHVQLAYTTQHVKRMINA
jgi:hypothetical protein